MVTKGTAICRGHPGLLAMYSVESSLLGCSVPSRKYFIAMLPDVNAILGNTSVMGTWVEIPGEWSSTITSVMCIGVEIPGEWSSTMTM